jgi:feruloyl esterase
MKASPYLAIGCAVIAALSAESAAAAAVDAGVGGRPVISCESLAGRQYYNVRIRDAVSVPAAAPLPAYCRVTGTEDGTDHDLEVRLPERWQQRYVQRGGGGFDGSVPPPLFSAAALAAGAVQGLNNGGHRDPTGAGLRGKPRAIERYAHGAILTATRFGKAVAQAYFGEAPRHSYYDGCSNGGRGALNAAAKYGSEFDGVVAAAPTRNLTGQIAAWTSAAALDLPSRAQFTQIHAAAVAKCDALDGLRDGIVSNWPGCRFDAARDIPASVGLTPKQQAAVVALTADLRAPDGQLLYSGFGTGDLGLGAPAFPLFGTGHLRSIVLGDATWTVDRFNLATDLARIGQVIDGEYQFSASVPDLLQFLKGGGRIIVWHGADDGLLSHRDTIRSWGEVTAAAGPELTEAATRFYIAPGVNHCAGGDGADSFDTLAALIQWVEAGTAPAALVATKLDAKTRQPQFTRPLCRYPAWPRYRGRGDPDSAASFECVSQ